ncbi:HlyD family type I secretion periplasmic adaptor subunit [Sulfurisoma sediminicola]|uniref:HlyD family type I secretion periplasmic adaptor subunit n=1 Tax=Sulfurisoma sediminicola TaxID=1381557 RepID=UPI0014046516|nr:HlyD family type I secretion periplasmic adaptor subunit [Sulfurisoma sediminicola]
MLPAVKVETADDPRRLIIAGLIVLGLTFGIGGIWMVFAPISGAVVANGLIKIDMNRRSVQHQEGGIVKQVLVRDGERVRQGQTLIVVEDVRVDASFDLMRSQHAAERARQARLLAERALARKVDFPPDLVARVSDARIKEILAREAGLFEARLENLEGQIRLLGAQVRQARDEAQGFAEQLRAEREALAFQKDELAANEDLLAKGYVQKTRVTTLQRAVSAYEAQIGEHAAKLAEARQKGTEYELRIIQAKHQFSQNAADELKDNTSRLAELEERLRPAEDAMKRQNVVAPVDGEVVDLRVTSAGTVLAPRDLVLDIVPKESKLIVEARIRPEDINSVRIGSDADVRLTSFKARLTPVVQGKVTYVSADRLTEKGGIAGPAGAPYYAVYLDVTGESLRAAGNLSLQAGMPAEVFIRTVERTPLQYLLEPITAYVSRAFREP